MAEIYGRDLNYFFDEKVRKDPQPLWRKSVELKKVNGVRREFLRFLENYSNLECLLELKQRWKNIQKKIDKTDFMVRGFELAEQLGKDIWRQLELGSRPAFNLLNVLENDLRIKVLHLTLPPGISGASLVDEVLGVGILINAKDAPWRRNFDLAHELFHIVTWGVFTHKEIGDGTEKTPPEKYADAFASSLLLPESSLNQALDEITTDGEIKLVDIIDLAKDFGVSTEAILWRLVKLNRIPKSTVEQTLNDEEFRRMDRKLRKGLYLRTTPSKFPARYLSLACRCLIEGKISRGVFARYVEIDRSQVDRYLRKHGFIDNYYEKITATRR